MKRILVKMELGARARGRLPVALRFPETIDSAIGRGVAKEVGELLKEYPLLREIAYDLGAYTAWRLLKTHKSLWEELEGRDNPRKLLEVFTIFIDLAVSELEKELD